MLSSTGVKAKMCGLIRNKINNEMMESRCDLAACEPWRLNLNPAERSPVFKRATGFGSPFRDTGALAASSWVPGAKRWLWEGSRHGCDSIISKKPVPLLLAGGTFGWPLLPSSAGHWPRVGSEALGKCDLLFDYILHRPMSRAGSGPCHRAGARQ